MHANPRKTASLHPLGPVASAGLAESILAIPESVWDEENAAKPNKFDALSSTRHIVFRFVSSPLQWGQSYDRPLWGEWKQRLLPVMEEATR